MRLLPILLALLLFLPALSWAEEGTSSVTGTLYEKPLAAEREANGFDPEGVEYHRSRVEDFQVVFVETAPFAALLSYGLTALIAYAVDGSAKMEGHHYPYLIGGTLLLSGGAAYLAVSSWSYEKPLETVDLTQKRPSWGIQAQVVQLRF